MRVKELKFGPIQFKFLLVQLQAKRIKEGLNGLIQEVWTERSQMSFIEKDGFKLINLVQTIEPSPLYQPMSTPVHASMHASVHANTQCAHPNT